MKLLLSWAVLSAAFLLVAKLLPGMKLKGVGGAVVAAAIFGVLNYFLGWIIFVAIGIATLGLGFLLAFITRWVVNVILLKLTDKLSDDLELETTGTAIAAALLISGVGSLGQWLVGLAF